MDDKMVIKDPVTGERLILLKSDWDKYQEHKKIVERGNYEEIMAYNKKMTK